jgi:hypothetical protein
VPVQPPLAVQLLAFEVDQFKVVDPPATTVAGVAVSVTVGAGVTVGGTTVTLTDWVADPPAPMQVKANEALLVSGPLDALPLIGLLPLQLPLAEHDVALLDDHVRVVADPEFRLDGDADKVTDGPCGVDGDCVTLAVTVCPAMPPEPLHVSV